MIDHLDKIYVLDFEATGLGHGSYPIEIGLTNLVSLKTYSWLIKKHKSWHYYTWNNDSALIHNIPMSEIEKNGISVEETIQKINQILNFDAILISDNPSFEFKWFHSLNLDRSLRYPIKSVIDVLNYLNINHEDYLNEIQKEKCIHRAADDALRIAQTIQKLSVNTIFRPL